MKKCPNCQKTFDDNMKFCQTDGTPLVAVADNKPEADPYATMVANKSDMGIADPPKDEPKPAEPEVNEEPKVEADPYATMVAPSQPAKKAEPKDNDEDILDILSDDKKEEEIDPMKTMVVSGNTADNIKVNIPEEEEEPKDTGTVEKTAASDKEDASEAQTILSPDIPKFNEPKIDPPNLSESKPVQKAEVSEPKSEPKKETPGSPFDSKPKEEKSAPIPSPLDDSMPPGYAPPSTPPFEPPKEPLKPEPLNVDPMNNAPKSPFSEPDKPVNEPNIGSFDTPSAMNAANTGNKDIQKNNQFESPIVSNDSTTTGQEGANKTLAIISLISGVLSFICCFSIVTGPLGLATGFMARKNIAENPGEYGGGTLALVGMILGGIGMLFFIILIILNLMGALNGLI